MIRNKTVTLIAISILLMAFLLVFFAPIHIRYSTESKVKLLPIVEWELSRTIDGNIITVFKDNYTGKVNSYSVTEFQRGDVVEFILNKNLFNNPIKKGDTIGYVYSNEEQRKLIELEGNLDVLHAEYLFYTTGQKPEDVEKAQRELKLARQELETQKKLMARSEVLIKDSVISLQQYEIDQNELMVKEIAVTIAESRLESINTGEKPEQAALINSKIEAIKLQIAQVRNRINYFTMVSPIDGIIAEDRGTGLNNEVLFRIIDTSKMIGLAPVKLNEVRFFSLGNEADILTTETKAILIRKDNVAQKSIYHSLVYFSYIIEKTENLTPGDYTDIKLYGDKLLLKNYLYSILTI